MSVVDHRDRPPEVYEAVGRGRPGQFDDPVPRPLVRVDDPEFCQPGLDPFHALLFALGDALHAFLQARGFVVDQTVEGPAPALENLVQPAKVLPVDDRDLRRAILKRGHALLRVPGHDPEGHAAGEVPRRDFLGPCVFRHAQGGHDQGPPEDALPDALMQRVEARSCLPQPHLCGHVAVLRQHGRGHPTLVSPEVVIAQEARRWPVDQFDRLDVRQVLREYDLGFTSHRRSSRTCHRSAQAGRGYGRRRRSGRTHRPPSRQPSCGRVREPASDGVPLPEP